MSLHKESTCLLNYKGGKHCIMPIVIPQALPATTELVNENIFVINEMRAMHQDIRPLKIGIVNLMPQKDVTETQLLRMLSNYPLQIEIDLIAMESRESTHTSADHLKNFYKKFSDIKDKKYDGMIITGAPVEKLPFSVVTYWDEMAALMDYTKTNVTSTLHICWAAQAALYYHYHIHNHMEDNKIFGVFKHRILNRKHPILQGFDHEFFAPHSRWTNMNRDEIEACEELQILADSDEAGIYLVASRDNKYFFVNGHSEYDHDTLKNEYLRDLNNGTDILLPKNYFPEDNPRLEPINHWKCHGNMLFHNWLNYFVYQVTPFDLDNGMPTPNNFEY